MSVIMTSNVFPFIVSDGPRVPKDPAVRTLIRKQAMRDVSAARKKMGNHGRINMRQYPVYRATDVPIQPSAGAYSVTSSDGSTGTGASSTTSYANRSSTFSEITDKHVQPRETLLLAYGNSTTNRDSSCELSMRTLSTYPDYECLRAKFGIDLVDLSILTNFNVGKSTIHLLSTDPSRLASLLGQPQRSFLEFVPCRYGISECLTAATNVLIAKAHTVLVPQTECLAVCDRLYGRALRSLQHALANEASAMDADVLCAAQLLSLHELFDASKDAAWAHHVNGSAHLIRHRSPSRFETEFEKSMFAAHVGAIISESLVNNTHCYLESPEWVDLYSSLIHETHFLTDRSSLTVKLRLIVLMKPGLWHDVGEVVNSPVFLSDKPMRPAEARCRKAHAELLNWLEDYKAHCVRLSHAQPPATELALRRELLGTASECLVIVKRLLATICEDDRLALEVETQALAHLIMDLQKQPLPGYSWLFSGQEVGVAYTVRLTKSQWEEQVVSVLPMEQRLVSRRRYNTWSGLLHRTA